MRLAFPCNQCRSLAFLTFSHSRNRSVGDFDFRPDSLLTMESGGQGNQDIEGRLSLLAPPLCQRGLECFPRYSDALEGRPCRCATIPEPSAARFADRWRGEPRSCA